MSCRTKSGEGALEPKGVCREKTKRTTTRTMVKAADCNVRNELDGGREIKRKRGEREGGRKRRRRRRIDMGRDGR